MKKNTAYTITTIGFIIVFLTGIGAYILIHMMSQSKNDVKYSSTDYKVVMKAREDTIRSKVKTIDIDINLISNQDSIHYESTNSNHKISADTVIYSAIVLRDSETFSVTEQDLGHLNGCRRVNSKNATIWEFSIEPKITHGNIKVQADLYFFKDELCTRKNDESILPVSTTIYIDAITFGAKVAVLGENMFKILIDNFLIFWTSFVGVVFTFVINKIKRRFKLIESNNHPEGLSK